MQFKNKSLIELYLGYMLLLASIVAFVPIAPKMPSTGVDASWALGLNQALAQGLSFGREILFTLGPYSSLYTKAYHPATEFMMLAGSLYLACSYWLCLRIITKDNPWFWSLAFFLLLAGMLCSRDSLFFSYPLLAGIACYKIAPSAHTGKNSIVLFLLFIPFALLALVKGTFFHLCLSIMIWCVLFFLVLGKKPYAFISFSTPLVFLLLFWLGCGQSMMHLPLYVANTFHMAAHFTEAMSTPASPVEMTLYGISSFFMLISIAHAKQDFKITRFFLFGLYWVFLFFSFKTGFTRSFGHVYIASTSLLFAALLLPFLMHSKWIYPIILLSLDTSTYIANQNARTSLVRNFNSTYSSFWHGLRSFIQDRNELKRDYALSMQFLQQQIALPKLHGTTDIYSYNQTYLIASNNHWSPRPVFQSYSVFTNTLAQNNKNHLLGLKGPDSIFFRVEPIDNRVPALEDGSSWPILLTYYQLDQYVHPFLLLKKQPKKGVNAVSFSVLATESHRLGEVVFVPQNNQLLFAELTLEPTILGYLATFFLSAPALEMHFELKDGTQRTYRLIRSMARSEFLLSPLVETTSEFALLYKNPFRLPEKALKSFSISSSGMSYWQSTYQIEYKVMTPNS